MYIQGRPIRLLRLIAIPTFIIILYIIIKNAASKPSESAESVDDIDFKVQSNVVANKHRPNYEDAVVTKTNEEITTEFLKKMDQKTNKCPDYVEYSQSKHLPLSNGKFEYPFMRPAPKCRTFTSNAVERLIVDLKKKVKDVDLARLIENCLPNTLDTTILWHILSLKEKRVEHPQSFVVTGDIHAEWLRDAARQLSVYQPLIKHDPHLKEMIRGAIQTQALFILNSPYCNAFHPPAGSGVHKGHSAMDLVYPRPDWRSVFECKYELDSLASFLTLSNEYYENSGDESFINSIWLKAYEKVLTVMKRESQPSFDPENGQALNFYYSFQRQTNIGSETLPLGGVGNPVNFGTGLVRSAFRPSDDATILQFFIPANMHAVTELKKARASFLNTEVIHNRDISVLVEYTDIFIDNITRGIEQYGIVQHPKYGEVYAYEVDGYGGNIFMDDANIPSLLSIPDMGFAPENDRIYQNTRKMILEKEGNPYYLNGLHFEGIGGPHIGIQHAWPMSLLVKMRTTDDDDEIMNALNMVMENTAGLGLMHESVQVNSKHGKDFTRSWFAWCNSEFGKTILHLAKTKPHLIFKGEYSAPYDIDQVLSGESQ
jgi:meiotically up-regulated gene 157 (Mug157) protein